MAERTPRQKAWASHGLKEVGRAVLDRFNKEVRPYLQKCNGTSRSTGEPCRNPVVQGKKKCRYHGGAVPGGDAWHTLQWPKRDAKNWQRKLNEKLARDERNRRRKERRLAKMTAEERAKYDEWVKYHRPGSKIERSKPRAAKKAAEEFRKRIENDEPRPVSPELAEMQAKIAALEEMRDHYRSLAEEKHQHEDNGVFG